MGNKTTTPMSFSADSETVLMIERLREAFSKNTGLPHRQVSKAMIVTKAIKHLYYSTFGPQPEAK